jgi:hypothetical protein
MSATSSPSRAKDSALPAPDIDEIRRALDVLHPDPTDVIELRALGVRSRNWPSVVSGYFLDRDLCTEAAAHLSPLAEGTYVTLNRINPALVARAVNRVRGRDDSTDTTADHDVIRRCWLPIDCDPVRPAGISSSDEERELAFERVIAISEYFFAEGWDEPVYADSGNGAHLLYRVSLPANDGGYVQKLLADLGRRFDDAQAKVDQTVYNPARIWKLYGTIARKGDHAPIVGRPHRLARLQEARV